MFKKKSGELKFSATKKPIFTLPKMKFTKKVRADRDSSVDMPVQNKSKLSILENYTKPIKGFSWLRGKMSVTIFALIVPVVLVAVILVGLISYSTASEVLKDQMEASTLQSLQQTDLYLQVINQKVDEQGAVIIRNPAVVVDNSNFLKLLTADSNNWSGMEKPKIKKAIKDQLRITMENNKDINFLWIIREGQLSFGVGSFNETMEEKFKYDEIPWMAPLQDQPEKEKGKLMWITVKDEKDQTSIVAARWITLAGLKKGSRFDGIMVMGVKPAVLQSAVDAFKESAKEGTFMFIIDDQGNVLSHSEKDIDTATIKEQPYVKSILNADEPKGQTTFFHEDGQEYFATYYTAENTGWKLVSAVPMKVMMKDIQAMGTKISMISVLCIVFAGMIAVFISLSITKPIKKMQVVMKEVEGGNLTARLHTRRVDELGQLSISFNHMLGNVNTLLKQSAASSQTVVLASAEMDKTAGVTANLTNEIACAIDNISRGLSEQSMSIADSAEMTNQLSKKIEGVVIVSDIVAKSSSDANTVSVEGKHTVMELKQKSQQTKQIVGQVITSIQELGAYSQAIENILKTITSISAETNLLSLNASIEAARAGDAGKGFAVVANEVRKLATQSSQAAGEIAQIISDIQDKITNAEKITDKVYVITKEQDEYVGCTENAFDKINTSIGNILHNILDLNTAVKDMDGYKNKITDSIYDVSSIAEESAAAAEEIAASTAEQTTAMGALAQYAHELNETAEGLKQSIGKFKI